jgi:hypothetical protein
MTKYGIDVSSHLYQIMTAPCFIAREYANYSEETLQVVLYTQCAGHIFVSFCHEMLLRILYCTLQKQHKGMLNGAPISLLLPNTLGEFVRMTTMMVIIIKPERALHGN